MNLKNKPKNNRKQAQIANRLRVLRLIYSTVPYSQRGIAQETEMQASTISNIVSELLEMGLIIEGVSLESGKVGPRETILQINPGIGHTIGVNIHEASQEICLIDGNGKVLIKNRIEKQWTAKTVDLIANKIKALQKQHDKEITGVGVAVPGVIDNETGVIILSRALRVENYDLTKAMSSRLDIPVSIDRNVIYGSYLEQHLHPSPSLKNSGYLLISKLKSKKSKDEHSIGMAITVNGEIYRGSNHAAGELDAVLLPSDDTTGKDTTIDAEPAFYGRLGSHLASVINLMDIGHLIVSSGHREISEDSFKRFSENLNGSLIPIKNRKFQLSHSPNGFTSIARGAALSVLHHYLETTLGHSILNS